MAVSRATIVEQAFRDRVLAAGASLGSNGHATMSAADLDLAVIPGSQLSARRAIALFTAQIESRILDFLARELKSTGNSFYTIGSSGHEGNAAVAAALNTDDMAFLHYRSGAFFLARAGEQAGPEGAFDILLGLVASRDEPIAGGRHKVLGSRALNIPPQTSTIASHLPKAVGAAIALDRKAHLDWGHTSQIVMCSFGDASANHATARAAFNAAAWCGHQKLPVPVLFVCEDNGLGISVRTPTNWIADSFANRHGIRYFHANGLSLQETYDVALQAVEHVRTQREPAFLHLQMVRMLGHAGSDVEQLYRKNEEIQAAEEEDPLVKTALLLIEQGWMSADQVLALYDDTRQRLQALAQEACRRCVIETAEQVMAPLFFHDESAIAKAHQAPEDAMRQAVFGDALPEDEKRPRHLAMQLNRALTDLLIQHPEMILFGEDVAKKGGVYHVTTSLASRFSVGRVFNTLLDETSILGLAIGAGHMGLLPFPEIQYLAYLMNAIDQLRGEAGSMQFFSQGQYANPMVIRIAALGYQKGFGGHFHNDNGIAALLEIPGLLVACPSRGDDAVKMLRTCTAAAKSQGRVCVFLEPIALYMTKDLHKEGDGAWLTAYPQADELLTVGELGVYDEGTDLCIASFANGLWMSLRVAARLKEQGVHCTVVDLRWLQPLPIDAVAKHAKKTGKLLIVDECRQSSGIASALAADVHEATQGSVHIGRLMAQDTYIPLGDAANLVLISEEDIEAAAIELLERSW